MLNRSPNGHTSDLQAHYAHLIVIVMSVQMTFVQCQLQIQRHAVEKDRLQLARRKIRILVVPEFGNSEQSG